MQGMESMWPLVVVGLPLAWFSIKFLDEFVTQAISLRNQLLTVDEKLKPIKRAGLHRNPEDLDEIVGENEQLKHAWSEYKETLHPQKEVGADGQSRVVRWRATAMAETFFSERAIVYAPLKADFYKHLPGIFTGLGIIGTFVGLISGLSSFDVSDPNKAQVELKNLINAVGHAFWASGAAITLAMIITGIEKSMVTARSRQLAELRQAIDSLFDAGAGEEYLERIVRASETQATQAAHIKDALVADLKEIMTSLTGQHLAAQHRSTEQLLSAHADQSDRLGRVIAERLGPPIADIAEAVKGVSANQGEAVNKLLTDVLASFSSQMQDMFGGQMRGMTDLLKETSEAMKQSAEKFATLASDMDAAGKGAAEAMTARLNTAITSMEARQSLMNKQMGEFVSQIKEMVSESQTESARKLQETLGQVGEQVAGVVAELQRQAEEAAEDQGRRQDRFEQSTSKAVDALSSQMEKLLDQAVKTNQSLQGSVDALSRATGEAIAGLNQGAETLYVAASDFAKAGQGVEATMLAAAQATTEINEASSALSTAATSIRGAVGDYSRTNEALTAMVENLESVTANARRDAAMTSEIIARIESATEKLGQAQQQSEDYLRGVNEVLGSAHESFAKHVSDTMRVSNASFQAELRTAVEMLSDAISHFGDTLDDAPGRRS